MFVYLTGGLAVLASINMFADAYVARAALIAAGWTMFSIAAFGFLKALPVLLSDFVGSDPVTASIKCIINSIIGTILSKAILTALGITIDVALFYVLTFILGLTALVWGYSRA